MTWRQQKREQWPMPVRELEIDVSYFSTKSSLKSNSRSHIIDRLKLSHGTFGLHAKETLNKKQKTSAKRTCVSVV